MKAFKGNIVHCFDKDHLDVFMKGYLVVNDNGKILYCGDDISNYNDLQLVDVGENFIVPGFVDCHVHLPQYSYASLGEGQLLDWLHTYTFPTEEKFASSDFALPATQIFFKDLVANGTTTAAIYCTTHSDATELAFLEAEKKGLRVILGKVAMQRHAPLNLLESPEKYLLESAKLIEKWHGKDDGRLNYSVTVRFAISCDLEFMKKCALLAEKSNSYIQTHLAENPGEILFVKELFPGARSYADVYKKAGLFTDKSLFAHCIHLDKEDIDIFKTFNSSMIHCPCSNRFLASGIFKTREMLDDKVTIGLGTDVAGGYSLSMLNEMKECMESSKLATLFCGQKSEVSLTEAFYMATLGGAKALKLDDKIGNFQTGKEADFVVLSDTKINPFISLNVFQSPLERLKRMIYGGNKELVQDVFVRGKSIHVGEN